MTKSAKGKPSERVGRKADGLRSARRDHHQAGGIGRQGCRTKRADTGCFSVKPDWVEQMRTRNLRFQVSSLSPSKNARAKKDGRSVQVTRCGGVQVTVGTKSGKHSTQKPKGDTSCL